MHKTTIRVHEIGPDGLELDYSLDQGWFARTLAGVEAEPVGSGVRVELRLERAGRNILARGFVSGALSVPCVRCLTPAAVDVGGELRMTYGIEEGDIEDRSDEDIEFTAFDGKEIALGELFREQILLALPIKALCQEDCQGLCAHCGKELNLGPCGCEQRVGNSRLQGLRDLKI